MGAGGRIDDHGRAAHDGRVPPVPRSSAPGRRGLGNRLMFDAARGRLADLGYAAAWAALKAVPQPAAERAFQAVADAATVRNGGGARQLRKNLRRVVGPGVSELRMDHLVGEALRSYSRYWLETFRLPKMDHREVAERAGANTEGAEN